MKRQIARILSGRFGRNIALMTGATVVGHMAFLLASPALTRLFDPSAFAVLSILMTLQALALAAATGRIEWSILTTKSPERAAALVKASLLFLLVATLGMGVALSLGIESATKKFALDSNMDLLLLALPISVLAAGLQLILHSWCVTTGNLKPIAISKLAQSILFVLIALAGGFFTGAGYWLAAGFTISHVVAGLILLALFVEVFKSSAGQSPKYIFAVVHNARREILASLGSSVLHRLAFYLPFLLIWALYDATTLGWFAFVFRMGTAPLSFLSGALAKGFWAEATDLSKTDPIALRRLFLKTIRILSIVGAAFAVFCLTAPLYFGFVFGEKWDGAGAILAAMTPMLFSQLVFSSTNHLIVYRRQHWQLWCDLLSIILFGGVFLGMAQAGQDIVFTLALSSFAFLVSYGLRFYLHLRANRLWTEDQKANLIRRKGQSERT